MLSDADVEDNLESDTSRCFNNAMTDSNATMDDSTIMEIIPESTSISLDHNYTSESQSTVFNVVYQTVSLGDTVSNGPMINSVTENDNNGEEVSVSFTIHENGITKENKTETEVTAVCHVNGFNGLNGTTESDFEFIDGPSVDDIGPAKTCHDSADIKKAATVNTSTVENFTVIENGTVSANEVNVSIDIPITQMNGHMVNGIGSSTDSEKLDANKVTLSANVNSLDDINEIVAGVSSLNIQDKASVDLSVSDEISKLRINDTKHENTEAEEKVRNNASKMVSSQISVGSTSEIKHAVLKSEIIHGERLNQAELSDEEIVGSLGNTMANPSNVSQGLLNTQHIQSDTIHCHPSSAKCNRSWKEIQREGKHRSVNTLRDRYHPNAGECSIESCLNQFTAAELLTGNNKFGCKNCTRLNHKHNPNKGKATSVIAKA